MANDTIELLEVEENWKIIFLTEFLTSIHELSS